jgi:hypothetical protein
MTADRSITAEGLLVAEPPLWEESETVTALKRFTPTEPTATIATLPTPTELAAQGDPSRRLLDLIEPATRMLVQATAVAEVDEIRAQAGALERYARSIRLSMQAVGAAQTIARRAEVRIGELCGPAVIGGHPKVAFGDDLSASLRHEFRKMADNRPTVEQALLRLAPEGRASRDAVLAAIRGPQRCAGCHTVFTGRANRLYCSAACQARGDPVTDPPAVLPEVLPLDAWTPDYAAEHVTAAWQAAVESIVETGRRLIEAKERVGHGRWLDTVALLPFSERTSRYLVEIASHPDLSNRHHGADLPAAWRTLAVLAQLPEGEIPKRIAAGEITPELDRATAQGWVTFYTAAAQEALNAWSDASDGLTRALSYALTYQPPASLPDAHVSVVDFRERVARLLQAVNGWEA